MTIPWHQAGLNLTTISPGVLHFALSYGKIRMLSVTQTREME